MNAILILTNRFQVVQNYFSFQHKNLIIFIWTHVWVEMLIFIYKVTVMKIFMIYMNKMFTLFAEHFLFQLTEKKNNCLVHVLVFFLVLSGHSSEPWESREMFSLLTLYLYLFFTWFNGIHLTHNSVTSNLYHLNAYLWHSVHIH